MLTLDEVAGRAVGQQEKSQYYPRDNLLFRYLYDAHCGLVGTGGSFECVAPDTL